MPGSVDNRELQRMVAEDNAQVIEVLPAEDYEFEHIAGATNLPLKSLTATTAGAIDRDRPIIVYCNDYL
jgi:rhodanese-related sulfurtransferase